ncbi:MAG: bifunctional diguanylate cyclase/phosphodiesterase [Candidatus Eremiobacteraeota bacterium]|nr:bifunctional diguanylate cyclase/phosphodiesterase [Candidatus Eremiobacteraeota bacterium]
MNGEAATMPRWRSLLGPALLLVSIVAIFCVSFQLTRLHREAALNPASAMRERTAIAMSARVVAAMRSVFAYEQALIVDENLASLPRLRTEAGRRIEAIVSDFNRGTSRSIAPADRGNSLLNAWNAAYSAKPGAASFKAVQAVVTALELTLQPMEDASNLTYDASETAQNLADARVIALPQALGALARVQTLVDLAIKDRALTLPQRFTLADNVGSLRSYTDLSTDDVTNISQRLSVAIPQRAAQFSHLPRIERSLYGQSRAFRTLLMDRLLVKPVPALSRNVADSAAIALAGSIRGAFDAFGNALDASLQHRADVGRMRNRYVYALYALGALFFIGAAMIVAQFAARRSRQALLRVRRESARLSAELARQQAEEALRLSEAQFRAVFDGATIGIAIVDRSGAIVDANAVFRTMFEDSIGAAMQGHEAELLDVFSGARETFEFEQHVRSPLGREIWTDVTVSMVNGPIESPLFAICMFRDKTDLKHSERRILHDQMHDALTGLPNRQLFEEHLRGRFAEDDALLDSFFAVLFVDIEHFKDVNESMGHAAGDLALTQVAQRVRGSIDARDVVARLGSDEFAILVRSLSDILHVETLARRILNAVSKPDLVAGKSVYLGATVGIAIGSSNYERAEDVMRDAEIAMQHARNAGGAHTHYALFDSKMHLRAQQRLQLTTDLRLAIERNEFRMVYQPVVGLNDGRLVGCEALIRWDHPTQGELNPTEFIALAEQTGLAAPIGRFVFRTAAKQLAMWRKNRGTAMEFMMHVNVSAAEVTDPEFERNLRQTVEQHGLAPSDFTVEITENVVLDAGTRANVVLERIRECGFKICIDDFGTGYSSLRYLQQFKVDAIKIDRSFVSGIDGELASEPIVRTLMTLAEAFDVRVVAEGVETPRQRDMLRNAGCRFAQGYMYARPLSPADMVALYPENFARSQRSASA